MQLNAPGYCSIRLSATAWSMMERCCRRRPDIETGGILIGHYVGERIAQVLHATPPPADSYCSRNRLVRGSRGLEALLARRWGKGQYYLGEWHYHPADAETPSFTDAQTILSIALQPNMNCPRPLLLVVSRRDDALRLTGYIYAEKEPVRCSSR